MKRTEANEIKATAGKLEDATEKDARQDKTFFKDDFR